MILKLEIQILKNRVETLDTDLSILEILSRNLQIRKCQ